MEIFCVMSSLALTTYPTGDFTVHKPEQEKTQGGTPQKNKPTKQREQAKSQEDPNQKNENTRKLPTFIDLKLVGGPLLEFPPIRHHNHSVVLWR